MEIEYRPRLPRSYDPGIGLIGCGGITKHHLTAYRQAGFRVLALCDLDLERAAAQRDEFCPTASVHGDYRELLARDDIEVVDIATHPPKRPPLIEDALDAGKHVLSQKPFVLDLAVGRRLVEKARRNRRQLAVNQNGRWAPHFSYAREVVKKGLIGEVTGVHLSVHWDHSWVEGTEFESVHDLILYDYAIHWFDILCCLIPQTPQRVFASTARSPQQTIEPPLLAQAAVEYEGAQASLAFDAHTPFGGQDRTFIAGTEGSISSVGPSNSRQSLILTRGEEVHRPVLEGRWFSDGFRGTMGELLCSIEEGRRSSIDAEENLQSLALCFAAVASAARHQPMVPGTIEKIRA